MVDSIFAQKMDEAGLGLLKYNFTDKDVSTDSTASTTNSISNIDAAITKYILCEMWSIILTSIGVILIVIISFWFLIKTLKKQMKLDEMKSNFTSNITHELKTPIAVAYAANDTLLNYGLDENPLKRKEYLNDIKTQLEKLSALVERILSMSMKERGNFKLELTDCNLKEIFDKITAETLLLEYACDIEIDVPENLSVMIDAKLIHLFLKKSFNSKKMN